MIMLEIRKVLNEEMKDALNLVWRVFLEYEAPDYTEEVIKEFKKFAKKADVIIANRYEDQLFEVREKVYTRDLYSRD